MRIPIWILLLSLLFLVSGCNREARDYRKAQRANTPEAYEAFVQKHPDSKFIEPAKAQAEELLLKRADDRNIIGDYRLFLKKYPESRHASEVTEKMQQLAPLKGQAASELRGWSAEGKLLVVVTVPLPTRPRVELDKYALRSDGKRLGQCVGIVPAARFTGGVTGMINDVRDNGPLPVAGLRPAKTVRNGARITNLTVQDFFYPLVVNNGLVVGQKLTMTAAGDGAFVLADPSLTYLLLADGFRYTSELRNTRQNGFQVPLKEQVSLLFVVPPPVDAVVALVSDEGISAYAAIRTQ